MSQPVLLKAYGNLWPAEEDLFRELSSICAQAAGQDSPMVFLEGDLLRISFEGLYFPIDDVVEAIGLRLRPAMQGKLDYLDLENWIMTRYLFANGKTVKNSAPLNNVLDYSGF